MKTKNLLIILVVWMLFHFWHTFVFGFYSDDWTYCTFAVNDTFASMNLGERLSFYINGSQGRPVLALAYFATSFLITLHNPIYWQAISAIYVLFSAVFFWLFVNQLFKYYRIDNHSEWADYATVFWLVSPWLLGSFAWATVSPTLISMMFFTLSGYTLFKILNEYKTQFYIPALLFFLSCMTYEAFYFQFLVFLGLIWIRYKDNYRIMKIANWFLVAQILPIIWNRASAFIFTSSMHKSVNPYWLQTFLANIISLPYAVFISSYETVILILILVIYLSVLFVKAGKTIPKRDKYLGRVSAFIAVGIIMSFFIYAVAGYTLWGLGTRGRTMLTAGLWIPIIFGFAFSNFQIRNILQNRLIHYTILILILLGYSQSKRSSDWALAWKIQRTVVAKIPEKDISQIKDNAVILVDVPFRLNSISLFDAFWTINMQMNYGKYFCGITDQKPTTIRQYALSRGTLHQINNTPWTNLWNGKELIQYYKNNDPKLKDYIYNPQKKTSASSAWLWKYDKNEFTQLPVGSKIISNPEKNYDYWMTYLWNKYMK